jgi:hypothetical protein
VLGVASTPESDRRTKRAVYKRPENVTPPKPAEPMRET